MEKVMEVYRNLTKNNIDSLQQIYSPEVVFQDPAHRVSTRKQLVDYFENLYRDCQQVEFTFHHHQKVENIGYLQWTMTLRHPKLRSGRPVAVDGVSRLRFDEENLIVHHQDYFDLGAMLYEHLPLIGRLIVMVKRRLGQ